MVKLLCRFPGGFHHLFKTRRTSDRERENGGELPRPSRPVMSVNLAALKSVSYNAAVQELNERIRSLPSKATAQWNNACGWM